MDIRKWSVQKRITLPDWCFGPKWWIGEQVATTADAAKYFHFSDLPPDLFVLWDVVFGQGGFVACTKVDLTLCLCRETPVGGNIGILDRLMRQLGTKGLAYEIHLPPNQFVHLGPMKILVEANNNGIGGVLRLLNESANCENTIACLVSALPKEVPDWVVSGLDGRL